MAVINFNANNVTPDEGRGDPLPTGWYNMMVISSELKPTRDTMGTILAIVSQVVDGQYAGRKVYGNFNMKNNSEKAQEIGHKQFSALCHAVRVLMVQDTAQVHNIPYKAKVKLVPADGQFEAKNEITAYKDINDATAGAPVAGVPTSMPPSRPMPSAPPGAPAFAPPQQAQAQAPAQAPAAQWQAPAAAQPWQAPGAPAAPVQQAPVQPVAPPVQQQAPTWNPAPAAQAPAPAPVAEQPAQVAAPVAPVAEGQAIPPWMQNQPATA